MLTNDNAEEFAKAAMNLLINSNDEDFAIVLATYSSDVVTFDSQLGNGYYVMCTESVVGSSGYGAVSLGMLTVTGNGTTQIGSNGIAKTGLPTVEKKVKENQTANYPTATATHETSDTSWNDVADYNIGDSVPFKLYGTLPSDLANYESYYYEFQDTLGTQFDLPSADNIEIAVAGKTVDISKSATDIIITIDKANNTISIAIEDIKKLYDSEGNKITVDSDSVITVQYSAVLNSTAEVGTPGQENKVKLIYSANPNENYAPTKDDKNDTPDVTGKTPEDKVIVYTYAVEINKTFFNAAGGDITEQEITNNTYKDVRFNLERDNSPLTFSKYTGNDGAYDYVVDKNGSITNLELTKITGTDGDELVIRIKGLDEGTYTLVETAGPSGFNLAADQTLEITANTNNTQTWEGTDQPLSEFSWSVNGDSTTGTVSDATASLEVQNKAGSSLPSTGGIGTTLFYLGGGCMVAVAGVFLISKKRMGKQEN